MKWMPISKVNPLYTLEDYEFRRYLTALLATHIVMQDALLISIDESSFKTNQEPLKAWQYFQSNKRGKSMKKNAVFHPQNLIELQRQEIGARIMSGIDCEELEFDEEALSYDESEKELPNNDDNSD